MHNLKLTISNTEICSSNKYAGLGGLLVTLKEGVSFEAGRYSLERAELVQVWTGNENTFGKPEDFSQYVRVFGPQFDTEAISSIIEEANLDSRYIFMRHYDSSEKGQGIEIAMSFDYTISFNR